MPAGRRAFASESVERATLPTSEMIMLMELALKASFKPAQTCDAAQLRAHQRHHMIPALERFVVGIPLVAIHNLPKLPPIDRFEELSKDAITILHARHFLSSTT